MTPGSFTALAVLGVPWLSWKMNFWNLLKGSCAACFWYYTTSRNERMQLGSVGERNALMHSIIFCINGCTWPVSLTKYMHPLFHYSLQFIGGVKKKPKFSHYYYVSILLIVL